MSDKSKEDHGETPKSLQDFVVEQYKNQQENGNMKDCEIDEERTANFFSRALGESQRMNSEVQKSHEKMAKLHDEIGADIFAQWRNEHSAEVLTKPQREAVENAHRETVAYRSDTPTDAAS